MTEQTKDPNRPSKRALARQFVRAGIEVQQATEALWTLRHDRTAVAFWPNSGRCFVWGKGFTPATIDSLIAALTSGRLRPAPNDRAYQPGRCKSCAAPVMWYRPTEPDESGRVPTAHPLNADGSSHFSNCPNAKMHRKPAASAANGGQGNVKPSPFEQARALL